MKRIILLLLFLAEGCIAGAQTPANPSRIYTIDMASSKVEFFVGSTVGDVNGKFGKWKGEFKVGTPGVPASATLNLEIAATSISTGSSVKDKTIKGKKFFFVEQYPTIVFTSTKVISTSDPNAFQVEGDFTLRGVTRKVVLQVTLDRDVRGIGVLALQQLAFGQRGAGVREGGELLGIAVTRQLSESSREQQVAGGDRHLPTGHGRYRRMATSQQRAVDPWGVKNVEAARVV